jgi:RNA polymerase sigma factor (TIGR02999 family)
MAETRQQQNQATLLLGRMNAGDENAARELLPLLYDELRTLAARQFRGQPANHTLQPTVLVHEAFLRLVGQPAERGFSDRKHFFAVAATAMRQILVNHARAKNADKRGGGERPVLLNDEIVGGGGGRANGAANGHHLDVLDLNEALEKLEKIDPRKHRVVELRFFAGLTVPEVADVMELSVTSIESEWRAARAWLGVELSK